MANYYERMPDEQHLYSYTGVVTRVNVFGEEHEMDHISNFEVYATDEDDARKGLVRRYKNIYGISKSARINMPDEIKCLD